MIDYGERDFVKYFNLARKNYLFELHTTNSNGEWSEKPLIFEIELVPKFTETNLFYGLIGMIILIILGAFYRNRLQNVRKENRLIELENAILRVQMNPHFIFNGLNSIRSFILNEKVSIADDFIEDFSSLMRNVLEIANNPYISIREEISLLEEYLRVEKVRFKNKFDYTFEVSEQIDQDEVYLPTMILQPFVENAIIHGFPAEKHDGLIQIKFRHTAKILHCIIEDNGVGRSITQGKRSGHNSKATDITKKRLNQIRSKKISLRN